MSSEFYKEMHNAYVENENSGFEEVRQKIISNKQKGVVKFDTLKSNHVSKLRHLGFAVKHHVNNSPTNRGHNYYTVRWTD